MTAWYSLHPDGVYLNVWVKTKASRNSCLSVINNALHIAIQALPANGDANKMLLSYLASLMKVPKSTLILHRGVKSRQKVIKVPCSASVQLFLAQVALS